MSKLQQLLLAGWLGFIALLAIMSVFVLPQIIQPPLSEGDRQTADTKPAQLAAEDARRKLQNEVRSTLLQGVGALFTFTAAGIAAYWTSRQLHVTREGQITDRFSRAIDQLASDKLDVQLGGIYALERIARDSPVDREAILQVLTTFVRERSPWPPSAPGQPKEAEQGKEGEIPNMDEVPPLQVRAPDIQAALTVLGRPGLWDGAGPLRLPNVDLRRADLVSVDLRDAILSRAHLEGQI